MSIIVFVDLGFVNFTEQLQLIGDKGTSVCVTDRAYNDALAADFSYIRADIRKTLPL